MKLFYQYMAIFFNFSPTSNHIHPLQVENCDSNSGLVVDEDDNVKSGLNGLMWMKMRSVNNIAYTFYDTNSWNIEYFFMNIFGVGLGNSFWKMSWKSVENWREIGEMLLALWRNFDVIRFNVFYVNLFITGAQNFDMIRFNIFLYMLIYSLQGHRTLTWFASPPTERRVNSGFSRRKQIVSSQSIIIVFFK